MESAAAALYGQTIEEPLPYWETEEEEKEIAERFKIESREKANWALRRIKEALAQKSLVEHEYNTEIERISRWRDGECEKYDREIRFFTGLLREFAHDELEKKGWKEKSISLSEGKMQFRKLQPKLTYDTEKLIEELEFLGAENCLVRSVKPSISEVRKLLNEGQRLKSVSLIEQEDSFSFSFEG